MNAEDYLLIFDSMHIKVKTEYINLPISANLRIFPVTKNDIIFSIIIVVLLKYRKFIKRVAAFESIRKLSVCMKMKYPNYNKKLFPSQVERSSVKLHLIIKIM